MLKFCIHSWLDLWGLLFAEMWCYVIWWKNVLTLRRSSCPHCEDSWKSLFSSTKACSITFQKMAFFMVATVRTNLTPMAQIFPPAYCKPLFIWTVSHIRTVWRTRFGKVYGPVMWQTMEWVNVHMESDLCEYLTIPARTFRVPVQLHMYSVYCASYHPYYNESKMVFATNSMDRTSNFNEGIDLLFCMSRESWKLLDHNVTFWVVYANQSLL